MWSGKRHLVCSGSRVQTYKKNETRDELNEGIDRDHNENAKVTFYDNVNLKVPGEYIIRGQVHSKHGGDGMIESVFFPEVDLIVASCLVEVTESKIVPIRVWTLKENTKIKKGQCMGEINFCQNIDVKERLNSVAVEKSNRWEALWPQFASEVNTLPFDYKKKLISLLKDYSDIFSVSKNDIGLTNMVNHEIDTGSVKPIACQYRRIPFGLEDKVDQLIQELVEKNIIRPSESPWNAPLVVIPKKNGDLRLTVDYRKLNSVTKRPIFPIPDSNQLFDTLNGSAFFSTLDLSSGYYNVPMKNEDIGKTAFSTRTNHWEFVRMPMGISTAPATFQRLMHKIFEKEKWHECLIYLDDILVFSRSFEEHLERLKTIFTRIRESGVKLSPKKCHFIKSEVSYLGHTISKSGIKTDEGKIEKVLTWPIPKTVEELRSFLGLCGYYRKFIRCYSAIVSPLEAACKDKWNKKNTKKKSSPLEWTVQLNKSFEKLKVALTSAPVLAFPSKTGHFILDTDASHECIGAVLSQVQGSDEKVIAYASRKLSQSERQYCITRKELLSVYNFVTHFKHYLLGRHFTVRTDHRSLCWLLNWKKPNTSQYCRWRQELEIYEMDVQYRKGEKHTNADSLSRIPNCQQCELVHPNPKQKRNVKILDNGEAVQKVFCRRINELQEDVNQSADTDLAVVIDLMKKGKVEEKEPESLRSCGEDAFVLWKKRNSLRLRGGLLHYLDGDNYRIIIPKDQRNELIKLVHETLTHIGANKMLSILREDYYWPNMDFDVRIFVKSCHSCSQRKVQRGGKKNERYACLESNFAFQKISIDVTGPLPHGPGGEQYILGIIDNFSRFASLVPLKRATAETVAKALYEKWITIFGIPEVIHSDRGTEFENKLIYSLCNYLGVRKSRSSPYYPQGNAMVERLFGTVKDMLSTTMKSRKQNWVNILPSVEFALRCSKNKSTNFTPYETIFGRKMKTPFSKCRPNESSYRGNVSICDFVKGIKSDIDLIQRQILGKRKLKSEKERFLSYPIGALMMAKILPEVRGLGRPRYSGPYKIVNRKGKWNYVLEDRHGKKIERNVHHLKPCNMSINDRSTNLRTSIESVSGRNGNCRPEVPAGTSVHQARAELSSEEPRYPRRHHTQPLRYGF